jgi:hypothetical protein
MGERVAKFTGGRKERIMAQPAIVILDEEPGQQLGIHLKAILQQESVYRIDVIGSQSRIAGIFSEASPKLVLPVLPLSSITTRESSRSSRI